MYAQYAHVINNSIFDTSKKPENNVQSAILVSVEMFQLFSWRGVENGLQQRIPGMSDEGSCEMKLFHELHTAQ